MVYTVIQCVPFILMSAEKASVIFDMPYCKDKRLLLLIFSPYVLNPHVTNVPKIGLQTQWVKTHCQIENADMKHFRLCEKNDDAL